MKESARVKWRRKRERNGKGEREREYRRKANKRTNMRTNERTTETNQIKNQCQKGKKRDYKSIEKLLPSRSKSKCVESQILVCNRPYTPHIKMWSFFRQQSNWKNERKNKKIQWYYQLASKNHVPIPKRWTYYMIYIIGKLNTQFHHLLGLSLSRCHFCGFIFAPFRMYFVGTYECAFTKSYPLIKVTIKWCKGATLASKSVTKRCFNQAIMSPLKLMDEKKAPRSLRWRECNGWMCTMYYKTSHSAHRTMNTHTI